MAKHSSRPELEALLDLISYCVGNSHLGGSQWCPRIDEQQIPPCPSPEHILSIYRLIRQGLTCLHLQTVPSGLAASHTPVFPNSSLPCSSPRGSPTTQSPQLQLLSCPSVLQRSKGEAPGLPQCPGPQESHGLACTSSRKDARPRGGAVDMDARQDTHRHRSGNGLESLRSEFKLCFQGVSIDHL